MPYHFTQPCPTCGRHMRIAIELLGRKVECQHCHAQFTSSSEEEPSRAPAGERPLMERVDEILRRTTSLPAEPTPRFSEPF